MIKPTPGRIVWYRPSAKDLDGAFISHHGGLDPAMKVLGNAPLSAQIVGVQNDRLVNLIVFDAEGWGFPRLNVPLMQDDDKDEPVLGGYAEWMPYQQGQAKKAQVEQGGVTGIGAAAANVISTTAAAALSHRDYQIEVELQATGNDAPRVKPEDITALIVNEAYMVTPSGRTTICELTLKNGFTVRGESSVVSIANFDAEKGKRYAREDATDKLWQLQGYLLAQQLYEGTAHVGGKLPADRLRDLIAIQTAPGTVDADEYMRGMANGLILALSVVTGGEPQYVEAEKDFKKRVQNEKRDLDAKMGKLAPFLTSNKFLELPKAEQDRMWRQHQIMQAYSTVLSERIAAFE